MKSTVDLITNLTDKVDCSHLTDINVPLWYTDALRRRLYAKDALYGKVLKVSNGILKIEVCGKREYINGLTSKNLIENDSIR